MSLEEFSQIKLSQGKHKSATIVKKPIRHFGDTIASSKNNKGSLSSSNASEVVVKVVSHIKKGNMAVLNYIAKKHHEDPTLEQEKDSLAQVTNYISREGDILLQHSSGADMDEKDIKKLMVQWNEQFKLDEKKNARAMTHIVMSSDKCTNPDEFKQIISETLNKSGLENYEYVFAIHRDTQNLHAHVVINNYGLDNKKLHIDKDWSQHKRLVFAETLQNYGYAHKATLKHHRDLSESYKKELAETEAYVQDYFSSKIKSAHPADYQSIIHLRKEYESTGNKQALRDLRKEIELALTNTTNSKLKLDRVMRKSSRLSTKAKVQRNISRMLKSDVSRKADILDKKQVATVTEMLLLEKRLLDKGKLSDSRYQSIAEIKKGLPTKLLERAEANLRRRQDPVFSKLENELLKYQRGVRKNGIDLSKHDERLFKLIHLQSKIANQSDNLSLGHKVILDRRLNSVIEKYKESGVNVEAVIAAYHKQKTLTAEIRLLRYNKTPLAQEAFLSAQSRIKETAITEKDRVRLERSLRKEFAISQPVKDVQLQRAEKDIRQSFKAIQTALGRDKVSDFSLVSNGLKLHEAVQQVNRIGIKNSNLEQSVDKAYELLASKGITPQAIKQHGKVIKDVHHAQTQTTSIDTFSDLLRRTSDQVISTRLKLETSKQLKAAYASQHPNHSKQTTELEKRLYGLPKYVQKLQSNERDRSRVIKSVVELETVRAKAEMHQVISPHALSTAKACITKQISDDFTQQDLNRAIKFQQALNRVDFSTVKAIKPINELISTETNSHNLKYMKSEVRMVLQTKAPAKFAQLQESEIAINSAAKAINNLVKEPNVNQRLEQYGFKVVQAMSTLDKNDLSQTEAYQKATTTLDTLTKHGIDTNKLQQVVTLTKRVERLQYEVSSLLEKGEVHKASQKINAIDTQLRKSKLQLPKASHQLFSSIKFDVSNKKLELTKEQGELAKMIKPVTANMTNLEKVKVRQHNQPYIERQENINQKLTGRAPTRTRSMKR